MNFWQIINKILMVVMLIAVNAVLPKMDEAKRNAFAIEANGVIKSAQQYVVSESIKGNFNIPSTGKCISLTELQNNGFSELNKDSYAGFVQITTTTTPEGISKFIYKVTLKNEIYQVVNQEADSLTIENIKDYDGKANFTCPTS